MDASGRGVAELLKVMEVIVGPRFRKAYMQLGTDALLELTPGVSAWHRGALP